MKEILLSLIESSEMEKLEFQEGDIEFIFCSYRNKDDFFLFMLISLEHIKGLIRESGVDLEYKLNALIGKLKSDTLKEYKARFIDKNLSLIVAINSETNSHNSWLYKVEENFNQSKKYVLEYNQSDIEQLKTKIGDSTDLIKTFNDLVIKNSQALTKETIAGWFYLLTKLYAKIPFLNFIIKDEHKQTLVDIEAEISDEHIESGNDNLFEKLKEYRNDVIDEFISKMKI